MGSREEEVIIFQQSLVPNADVQFRLPSTTSYLVKLSLVELAIRINAADVGNNTDTTTLELINPITGLVTCNGNSIVTVPNLDITGTKLYRQYQAAHLVLLKKHTQKSTEKDLPVTIRIRKGDGTVLLKDSVYMRFAAEYAPGEIWDLTQDRFTYQ